MKNERVSGYEPICDSCAKEMGGKPKDGVCTASEGVCSFCLEKAVTVGVRNYNWGRWPLVIELHQWLREDSK